MKITIIGSGNVAYHLAKAFVEHSIPVNQIFGRNESRLKSISKELKIPYSIKHLDEADFYLIAVSDDAIEGVSKTITSKNCLVAHTSGSLPIETLKGDYRKACFYPLQTFSKTKNMEYEKIPFFIETEEKQNADFLMNLARKISDKVMLTDYEKRKYLHLAAVFSCNFVNHLYTHAKNILDSQDIPFEFLLPLIEETTDKIKTLDPQLAQTGPAVRNDERVLQLHEDLIKDGMQMKIYQLMNESIKEMHNL